MTETDRARLRPGQQVDPVELGGLLFTLVEPDRGHEVAYNRWYEHDHFYAGCLSGPHCFAGDRFVATRRLKDLRYPEVSDLVTERSDGSYLALYWVLAGRQDEWNRWAVDRVLALHEAGRMFPHRRHVHTQLYDHRWSVRREPGGCAIELALDHGYPGLVVVVGDVRDGHARDEVDGWFRDAYLPDAMRQPWGPDVVGSAKAIPLLADAPSDVGRVPEHEGRFLQLHFLDHDPAEGWDGGYGRLGADLEASGLADVVWVSPFIRTVFGTDTYTDELW